MSRPRYGIHFPLVRERTGYRRGPRFRWVPNDKPLSGAQGCSAGMIKCAILSRDSAKSEGDPQVARAHRAQMRTYALWARIFAGHMENDAPLVSAAVAHSRQLTNAILIRNTARCA